MCHREEKTRVAIVTGGDDSEYTGTVDAVVEGHDAEEYTHGDVSARKDAPSANRRRQKTGERRIRT